MISQEGKADESSLIQIIRIPEEPGGTVPLEVLNCSDGWKSSGFASAVDVITAIVGHASTPFDMGEEMVRSLLVKLPSEIEAPKKHLMMISIHHAIMDGMSVRIILRDLLTAYCAYAA
ncbi:MAG: hypothetical protein GY746_07685, partial [Gammaproteobacteria bacterium]|nr:hypothetical protein [Gammaproteobacteria bacterium]